MTILRLEDSALVVLGAIFAVVEVLHHLVELLGHEPLGGPAAVNINNISRVRTITQS